MPSAKITYDPKMRDGDAGRRLYAYWKKIRVYSDAEEFQTYPGFYNWAMENGYTIGAKLFRYDFDKPYSPDNCFWSGRAERGGDDTPPARDAEWEKKWDDAVNRIRKHFGMAPIHSSEV